MITVSILLVFFGFEFFYQCSQKAELTRSEKIADWFNKNEKAAKISGSILLASALTICIFRLGIGAGIFGFLCMLMLVGSSVVLISPLRKVKISWLMAGMLTLFILEII